MNPSSNSGKPLVIFDLDGTLFQTDKVWVEAIQEAQRELGLEVSDAETITSHFNEPPRKVIYNLARSEDDELIGEFYAKILEIGEPLILKKGRLYPGISEVLDELEAQGFEMYLCTNASKEYAEYILANFGIDSFFSRLASGEDYDGDKQELVRGFMQGCSTAVMVGDRSQDFLAARACNIPSIGVSYGFGGAEVYQADYVADSASGILTFIKRIDIFSKIEAKLEFLASQTPRIIGVDGVDTSGKTSFSAELETYLACRGHKTALLHLDDFHNLRQVRNQGNDPVQSYFDHAFNLELLQAEILEPLSRGEEVDTELTLLDLDSDRFENLQHYRVDSDTVVILEGVLLNRKPLKKYFALRVFLDIPWGEMLQRAAARDVPRFGEEFLERYKVRYIPIQERYLEEFTPRKNCDFVIDNTDFSKPVLIFPLHER